MLILSCVRNLELNQFQVTGHFYPLNDDIHNHIGKAKRMLELSRYDQDNPRLKIEEWKKNNPQSSFFP